MVIEQDSRIRGPNGNLHVQSAKYTGSSASFLSMIQDPQDQWRFYVIRSMIHTIPWWSCEGGMQDFRISKQIGNTGFKILKDPRSWILGVLDVSEIMAHVSPEPHILSRTRVGATKVLVASHLWLSAQHHGNWRKSFRILDPGFRDPGRERRGEVDNRGKTNYPPSCSYEYD